MSNAVINLGDQTLTLNSPIQMPSQEEIPSTSVHAFATMVIPPISEAIIPATVNDSTTHDKTGIIEPTDRLCEGYQLHGAIVLATASTRGTIPFRVLNPTSKPTTLYKATTLGNFPILPPITEPI